MMTAAITTADRVLIRRTAAEARVWLQEQGVEVIDSRIVNRTPVLSVAGPVPTELTSQVMVIHERLHGGLERHAWLARLGGCCVHWREQ